MGWELDWLENRARISPNSIAVVDSERNIRFTYSQMNVRAIKLASMLQRCGVIKGDRVALLAPNHICYFDLLFGCGKIGAIFVPLNWRLSNQELQYIVNDCTPKVLALHSTYQHIFADRNDLKNIMIDSSEYLNEYTDYDDGEYCLAEIDERDPLAIIYTGGTTGKPKGVVLSHRSIMWNGINTILSWNLTADDVTLTYLPMFHTGGLNALSIPILMMGGKVVIASDFDPVRTMEIINQEGCTVVLLVPTMYHMIVNTPDFEEISFPTMKTFLSGGAPCPLEIYQAFENKGIAFKEGYGLTEAGPNNFYIDPTIAKIKRGSIGKPMMFNQIKLIKSSGEEALPFEVGEMLIQGDHVFEYYWNKEDETKKSLKDGWLYTGDLAKKDDEGYHYIVGRKKEMIITGGENVYPLEVEHCIAEHPAVDEVAVIGIPHLKWGEIVTAVISLKRGYTLTCDDIIEFCLDKLGKYKIPKKIFFIEQLPKTHVGKVDKNILKTYCESIAN